MNTTTYTPTVGNTFKRLLLTMDKLLEGTSKFAGAYCHIGGWAEETAGQFEDTSRISRLAIQKEQEALLLS